MHHCPACFSFMCMRRLLAWLHIIRSGRCFRYRFNSGWNRWCQQLLHIGSREDKRTLTHIQFVGAYIPAIVHGGRCWPAQYEVLLAVLVSIGNVGKGAVLDTDNDGLAHHFFIPDMRKGVVAEETGHESRDSVILPFYRLLFV